MNADRLEKLAMALSSDWFLPYWERVGLGTTSAAAAHIQSGMREVVDQIVGLHGNYWNADFSTERRLRTKRMFCLLLKKDEIASSFIDTTKDIIDGAFTLDENRKIAGILNTLIVDLINSDQNATHTQIAMSPLGFSVVLSSWEKINGRLYFDALEKCSRSSSDWDIKLKSLTPELPCALADFILQDVIIPKSFLKFLKKMEDLLQPDDLTALLKWFAKGTSELDVGEINPLALLEIKKS